MLIPLEARSSDVVTLDEVKQHLNVEHDERDDLIRLYLAGATDYVAGQAELALGPTSFEQRLDCWPIGCVRLDMGPVRDIDSVLYLDIDGTEQQVAEGDFAWEPTANSAELWFTSAFSRPRLADRPGAIRVLYIAGFNDPTASDGDDRLKLPAQLRVAVLMLVGHWWKTREPIVTGQIGSVPFSVDDMIDSVRVWRS